MTGFRPEDTLVGIVAVGAAVWVAWLLRRGLSEGVLPIGRGRVRRDERSGTFRVLLAFYVAAFFAMAAIAGDLLLGLRGR